MTETLQGIPSIIPGLFGMIFVNALMGQQHPRRIAHHVVMMQPLVIRSTEEALMAVPLKLREATWPGAQTAHDGGSSCQRPPWASSPASS